MIAERIPPGDCISSVYYAACVAGTEYTIRCRVFSADAVTDQPILRCEAALGQASTSDTATDAETGTSTTPSTWEQLSISVTTSADGSLAFWVENPDATASIDVALVEAVEA